MSWPDGERTLRFLQSLVVSVLLISRIHSGLFSDWRRTVSLKCFDTQVPSISTEELVLPGHARCVLSRLRCNGHSLLLGSYLSKIGRIENPSCSACGHSSHDISHLILHCPAADSLRPHSLATVSLRPLVQTLGSWPASGAPWFSVMPPSLGRGRVNNKNKSISDWFEYDYSFRVTKSRLVTTSCRASFAVGVDTTKQQYSYPAQSQA